MCETNINNKNACTNCIMYFEHDRVGAMEASWGARGPKYQFIIFNYFSINLLIESSDPDKCFPSFSLFYVFNLKPFIIVEYNCIRLMLTEIY